MSEPSAWQLRTTERSEGVSAAVAAAARACIAGELGRPLARPTADRGLRVAAVGTTAAHALRSAMLADALAAQRMHITSAVPYGDLADLVAGAAEWDLGLVLSPFKPAVRAIGAELSPSARDTGIVDTLLTDGGRLHGVNTNSWALAEALGVALRGQPPSHVLLLGAGATARSAVLGLTRRWPGCRVTVSARREDAARGLAEEFSIGDMSPVATATADADVVINSTTWGETADSETVPFGYPLERVLRPGVTFFDLNNRLGALQQQALAAGCVVLSGTLMQRMTHACRAAAARRCVEEATDDQA